MVPSIQLALLGEMTAVQGHVHVARDPKFVDEHGLTRAMSYAAQTPWLQYRTIKDNILFGSALDAQRYDDVLEACALKPDLEVLEHGDATEIGPR